MFNVVQVKFDPLSRHLIALSTATIDLGPTGHSRPHPVPLLNERNSFNKDIIRSNNIWRGSDNRHFTAQNIDELWQTIDPCPAQDAANTRHN